MAGPWEQFQPSSEAQSAPAESGPWSQFSAKPAAEGPAVAATPGEREFAADKALVEQAAGLTPGALKAANYAALNAFFLNAPSHVVSAYTALKEGRPYKETFEEQKRYEKALERQYPTASTAGTVAGMGAGFLVPMGAVGQAGRLAEAGMAAKLAGTAAPEIVKKGAAKIAGLAPAAGVSGAMSGIAGGLENLDPQQAVRDAAIGAGVGAAAQAVLPAVGRYFSKYPDAFDSVTGKLKPEHEAAVQQAFEGRMSQADIDSFKGELAASFKKSGPTEAAAKEALLAKETGQQPTRSMVTGERPTTEATGIAEKGAIEAESALEAKRAGMAAPAGSPTGISDVLHGAQQAGKADVATAYKPVDTAKGRFVAPDPDAPAPNLVKRIDPKTGEVVWRDAYFLPSINQTLRAAKMPTTFSAPGGTQDLYPQAAKAKQFLEEGLGSGRAPDPGQPFTFPNLELVKRTLNKFAKDADPRDAEIIRKMGDGYELGLKKMIDANLYQGGNGRQIFKDLMDARAVTTEFKNKFYDNKGPEGQAFARAMKALVDSQANKITPVLSDASAKAAQDVLTGSMLNRSVGLGMYDRFERILKPNSAEMGTVRDQIRNQVLNVGGDMSKLPSKIDEFLRENSAIASRVFTGQQGAPSVSDLRRMSEAIKIINKKPVSGEQKESMIVNAIKEINSALAGGATAYFHGPLLGTAAYVGSKALRKGSEAIQASSRRAAERAGAPNAEFKAPESMRFIDKPPEFGTSLNVEPALEDQGAGPGYRAPTPLPPLTIKGPGNRMGRKSGGRVSDRLVAAVDRAKKNINNQTQTLLRTPDNHVAQALEIANRNLES
jgi:hypothetical protein